MRATLFSASFALAVVCACSSSSNPTGTAETPPGFNSGGDGGGPIDGGVSDGTMVSTGFNTDAFAAGVDAGVDAAYCFPDNDGINGGFYKIDLTVDDTGFSKKLLTTQNDAEVQLTLTNKGTKPHGFEVGCTTTTAPAGCPTRVCFPGDSTIDALKPGESKQITFATPTPDGIIYPFRSTEAGDTGSGFDGQWSLM